MSDISKDINCNIISFADDTRLYSVINSPADCDSLQCDLSNVYKWAESNNMKFNSKKFQYINFTVSPQCNTSNVYVSADSNLIDPSHTVKDLGVLMSNDCMFDDHICQVTIDLYTYTPVHSYALVHLYICTPKHLCTCTVAHPCTLINLYTYPNVHPYILYTSKSIYFVNL